MGFALLLVAQGVVVFPRLLLGLGFGPRRNPTELFREPNPTVAPSSRRLLARAAAVTLGALMLAACAASLPKCYALPKQDYAGARDFVESHRRPDDAVVAVGLAAIAYGRYYAPHWTVLDSRGQLDAVRAQHKGVWLVYTLPNQLDAFAPDLLSAVQQDFDLVRAFPGTLNDGQVFVCRSRDFRSQHSTSALRTAPMCDGASCALMTLHPKPHIPHPFSSPVCR
jgi:hypothetical protein